MIERARELGKNSGGSAFYSHIFQGVGKTFHVCQPSHVCQPYSRVCQPYSHVCQGVAVWPNCQRGNTSYQSNSMPDLTMEEVEQKVLSAKPWKAPGEDGLPAMVWKQLWPVVKKRVLLLFQTSLQDSNIPS